MCRNILLASYGAGHAEIIAQLAQALIARGDKVRILGFTTAYHAFKAKGLPVVSVEALLDPAEDQIYLDAADEFCGAMTHPYITQAETRAYFAIGLRDLVLEHGWDTALDMTRQLGRKAFLPVDGLARFLKKNPVDIVVSTTSPRFEHALHIAARRVGTPSLAIGDLFLTTERKWVTAPDYAPYLAVICDELRDEIIAEGFCARNIRTTGNPAFDKLAPGPDDARRRAELRASIGLDERERVVLWPGPGSACSSSGKPFNMAQDVVAALEPCCRRTAGLRYIIRPHPNFPVALPKEAAHGILDSGLFTPEEAILVSDVVCFDISTMGLQGALAGLPAISVGFEDEMPYARYGLALSVKTMTEAARIIETDLTDFNVSLSAPPVGQATAHVLAFVDDILAPTNDIPSETVPA